MPKDDVQVEPIRGLPELPPEGEHILWQGAPDPWTLALQALNTGWVAGYFALLAAWRGLVVGLDQGWALGAKATVPFLGDGAGRLRDPRGDRGHAGPDHRLHADEPARGDADRGGADRHAEPALSPASSRRIWR